MSVVADLAWRGMVHQVTDDRLGAKMAAEPFSVYHGIDASADSLHVGNLLGVIALQRLQVAGHRPIVLLGGGTSLIGDPSGKTGERPIRTVEEVRSNVEGIRRQLERFIDFDRSGAPAAAGAVLVDNADWLCPLPLVEFLRDVGKHFTVNAMMAKESVRARLETREQGISFTEFSYMLLQAYDYLHLYDTLGSRLQIGGSDQWGNITAGVDLVRRTRGAEVYGLTWPLLTRADGTKFGKSESGNVWLDPGRTSPYQFFQYWVRQDDRDVGALLRLFTDLDAHRILELEDDTATHPERRRAQSVLARELTARVHGEAEAAAAERAARVLFGATVEGGGPGLEAVDERTLLDVFAEVPSADLPRSSLEQGIPLLEVLVRAGAVPSRSAGRRDLEQGAISLNHRRQTDPERPVTPADLLAGAYVVLRRGKRSYTLVRFRE